jgi:hypothetical protein
MSLTSYRAAPPRVREVGSQSEDGSRIFLTSDVWGTGFRELDIVGRNAVLRVWFCDFCSEDLAATYSPTS